MPGGSGGLGLPLGSRENKPSKISRLADSKLMRAMRSWTGEGDQGQIMIRHDKEQLGKLTLWLGSGGTGDWNGQRVDVESAEGEEGESCFGEHDGVS